MPTFCVCFRGNTTHSAHNFTICLLLIIYSCKCHFQLGLHDRGWGKPMRLVGKNLRIEISWWNVQKHSLISEFKSSQSTHLNWERQRFESSLKTFLSYQQNIREFMHQHLMKSYSSILD